MPTVEVFQTPKGPQVSNASAAESWGVCADSSEDRVASYVRSPLGSRVNVAQSLSVGYCDLVNLGGTGDIEVVEDSFLPLFSSLMPADHQAAAISYRQAGSSPTYKYIHILDTSQFPLKSLVLRPLDRSPEADKEWGDARLKGQNGAV